MSRKYSTKTIHISIPLHTKIKIKASREKKKLTDFANEILILGLKEYIQNQKGNGNNKKEN